MTQDRVIIKVLIRVVLTLARHWYARHADRLSSAEEGAFLDDIQALTVFNSETSND